jgi:hypothetical protein
LISLCSTAMNKKIVHFNDALRMAADILDAQIFPDDIWPLVIRDIQGRIRIGLKNGSKEQHKELAARLEEQLASLGKFAGNTGKAVLFPQDFFDPDSVFAHPDILDFYFPGTERKLRLLDRQIVGQDWLRPESQLENGIPRVVFFGLKGGVGRSTALTMLAYKLAQEGKRILLLDFDLESPGLSSLLLPPERLADFGIVDWFVEDAVGQGDAVLERMIAASPLAEHTQGEIRVAAAMGLDEKFYLAKLSRVYAETAREGKAEHFSARMRRLLEALERQEQPDVVLIDSRAGLHDLAAASIVSLATDVLLFGTDSAQTWQGYRLLFSHWQAYPAVSAMIRERLKIVEALFPELNQVERAERFLENSYSLFAETLYEEIEPETEADSHSFNFDLNDEAAPHYPLRIKWNSRFQEFDPLLLARGVMGKKDIEASYGEFVGGMQQRLTGGI